MMNLKIRAKSELSFQPNLIESLLGDPLHWCQRQSQQFYKEGVYQWKQRKHLDSNGAHVENLV